jgi:hypothetical protein
MQVTTVLFEVSQEIIVVGAGFSTKMPDCNGRNACYIGCFPLTCARSQE